MGLQVLAGDKDLPDALHPGPDGGKAASVPSFQLELGMQLQHDYCTAVPNAGGFHGVQSRDLLRRNEKWKISV